MLAGIQKRCSSAEESTPTLSKRASQISLFLQQRRTLTDKLVERPKKSSLLSACHGFIHSPCSYHISLGSGREILGCVYLFLLSEFLKMIRLCTIKQCNTETVSVLCHRCVYVRIIFIEIIQVFSH